MKTEPITLTVSVNGKGAEKALTKITKAAERTGQAFTKLNGELEKHKVVNINFELKKLDKKWHQKILNKILKR